VLLSVRAEGEGLLIVVDDSGPGVPHELRSSVFEIFDRGGKDPSGVPGMGVGLSIVAQFAAVHGGKACLGRGRAGRGSILQGPATRLRSRGGLKPAELP
jgi:two-component system sensor histidine kinase PrrB